MRSHPPISNGNNGRLALAVHVMSCQGWYADGASMYGMCSKTYTMDLYKPNVFVNIAIPSGILGYASACSI